MKERYSNEALVGTFISENGMDVLSSCEQSGQFLKV